jgi:hypothetical protein
VSYGMGCSGEERVTQASPWSGAGSVCARPRAHLSVLYMSVSADSTRWLYTMPKEV